MLNVADSCPSFSLEDQDGNVVTTADLKGKNVVFYFYPKDNTPGCTIEGQEFSSLLDAFNAKNTLVFGISKDSVKKHNGFCNKFAFKHRLLSDPEGVLCQAFGVWQQKSMFGKKYMGIVRATFLVDTDGTITNVWPTVKVKGHALDVLDTI